MIIKKTGNQTISYKFLKNKGKEKVESKRIDKDIIDTY